MRRAFTRQIRENLLSRPVSRPPLNHPHQEAAYYRNVANDATSRACSALGLSVYELSPVSRDQGYDGERCYYESKDLRVVAKSDPVAPSHVFRFIDVDYYPDMYYWCSFGKPILMCTIIPTSLQNTTVDTAWTFDDQGRAMYRVTGGARYLDELWDWAHDTITVNTWTGTIVYDVAHFRVDVNDPNRAIGALVPAIAPSNAWESLGLIYGDYGVLEYVDPDLASSVAKRLGLTLKVDVANSGSIFRFLGRVFLDPWVDGKSIQDPARTYPKLHLTMSDSNVPINVAARYRADAYLVTDPFTPVISEWCHWVRRHYTITEKDVEKYQMYLVNDRPFHYVENDSWYCPEITDRDTLVSLIAHDVGVGEYEIRELCRQLNEDEPQGEWRVLPWCLPVKIPVIVDGELRVPKGSINEVTIVDIEQQEEKQR